MPGIETRSVARNSLFLFANVRVEGESGVHRVRVRNLSDGGMMAEGALQVQRGHRLEVDLRGVGEVGGSVAWVQDKRFGIAFDREIESHQVRRQPEAGEGETARFVQPSRVHRAPSPPDTSGFRKV